MSRQDDSNKWSNIGFDEEIGIIEIKICTLSGAVELDVWNDGIGARCSFKSADLADRAGSDNQTIQNANFILFSTKQYGVTIPSK